MFKKSLYFIGYYGVIFVMISHTSCISLDPEPCDTPIERTIGLNGGFSITPLKDNYNIGDKIKLLLVVDNVAKLQLEDGEFKLYEKTNEEMAKIYGGLEDHQDLAHLIAKSINLIDVRFGGTHSFGYVLRYDFNLKKYILELEITLKTKRAYSLSDFSYTLLLGRKSNRAGYDCHYYEHKVVVKLDSIISFRVD
ncbi:hypothetical protein [Tenacibaculum maritimum]|uniref:hypothetical protein n=1 Tax=Tenacibaculum maritimum TaxID=107401 RepID=UPI0010A4A76C|nr:hypothetical protein [Tenacibaculum maritimum]QCD61163.1 hypothetical protein B9C57_00685 [Tenacibaculum maritimum]